MSKRLASTIVLVTTLFGGAACAYTPRTVEVASRYIDSGQGKKVAKGLTFFQKNPFYVDDATALRLERIVRSGPHQLTALYVLAASGRPEVGALLDELDEAPSAVLTPSSLKNARVKWESAAKKYPDRVAKGKPEAPTPALATREHEPVSDIVRLKGGGRVVGKVLVDDKTEVVIQLADGSTKRVPHRDIAGVDYANE